MNFKENWKHLLVVFVTPLLVLVVSVFAVWETFSNNVCHGGEEAHACLSILEQRSDILLWSIIGVISAYCVFIAVRSCVAVNIKTSQHLGLSLVFADSLRKNIHLGWVLRGIGVWNTLLGAVLMLGPSLSSLQGNGDVSCMALIFCGVGLVMLRYWAAIGVIVASVFQLIVRSVDQGSFLFIGTALLPNIIILVYLFVLGKRRGRG